MIILLFFLAILIVGGVLWIVGVVKDDGFSEHPLIGVGCVIAAIGTLAVATLVAVHIFEYAQADATLAEMRQEYVVLVYQLENDVYENDNDIGKQQLFEKIQEWNTRLASNQARQDNVFFGFAYPDIYDQLEFIELPTGGE